MSKEKDNFSEKKLVFEGLNTELLYKMVISDEEGMHILGCRMLEGFIPDLSQKIKASLAIDTEIVDWIKELGFGNKQAKVIYATYKIAKFKTKVL